MGTMFSQSKWEIQFNNFIHTNICLLKVNNRNTKTSCEIRSKLTINISERRQRRYQSRLPFPRIMDDYPSHGTKFSWNELVLLIYENIAQIF